MTAEEKVTVLQDLVNKQIEFNQELLENNKKLLDAVQEVRTAFEGAMAAQEASFKEFTGLVRQHLSEF